MGQFWLFCFVGWCVWLWFGVVFVLVFVVGIVQVQLFGGDVGDLFDWVVCLVYLVGDVGFLFVGVDDWSEILLNCLFICGDCFMVVNDVCVELELDYVSLWFDWNIDVGIQ